MALKVDKESVEAVIITEKLKILGCVYMFADERVTDFMESSVNQYLAVTDSVIYNLDSEKCVDRVAYLCVKKEHITAIYPVKHIKP
ncbi:MAG: hypothetical protein ACQES8_09350 [Thermodesulfobacteriota bacterium]